MTRLIMGDIFSLTPYQFHGDEINLCHDAVVKLHYSITNIIFLPNWCGV